MEELSMDQRSEVTCPRLHSLSGPELDLLTSSCELFLSPWLLMLVSQTFTHGLILSLTQKASSPAFIFLPQSILSTYVKFLILSV